MQSNNEYNKGQPPFDFETQGGSLVDKIVTSIHHALREDDNKKDYLHAVHNSHLTNNEYLFQKACNELIKVVDQPDADAKSARISMECREKGNQYFKMNKLDEASEAYTMSIAYAPPGSRELSLAYANRSAVLFKAKWMTDCLADIEHALSLNYPDNLKAKLYLRQANCLQALNPKDHGPINKAFNAVRHWLEKIDDKNKESMRQLLKEHETLKPAENLKCYKVDFKDIPPKLKAENPIIPGLSDAVELKYSDKYGRHYVATRDIKPGEIIGVQKPYVNVIVLNKRYKLCWHCGKQAWSNIPCDGCAEVIYCSTTCRDKSHVEYHDIECFVLRRVFAFGTVNQCMCSLRLTIKALKEAGNSLCTLKKYLSKIDDIADPIKKVLTQGKLNPEKFTSVYGLEAGTLATIYERIAYLLISILMGYFIVKSDKIIEKKSEGLNILKDDDLFLFFVDLISKNNIRSAWNMFEIVLPYGNLGYTQISYALTPAYAFLNHSCIPMTNRKRNGDYLIISSICPIKKGEIVSDNYDTSFTYAEKSVRQAHLKKFNFVCDCEACLNDWPGYDSLLSKTPQSAIPEIMKPTAEATSLKDPICEFVRCNNRLQNVTKEIVKLSKHLEKSCHLFKKNSLQAIALTTTLDNTILLSQIPFFSLD